METQARLASATQNCTIASIFREKKRGNTAMVRLFNKQA
jgi:hypothetical protein